MSRQARIRKAYMRERLGFLCTISPNERPTMSELTDEMLNDEGWEDPATGSRDEEIPEGSLYGVDQ